MKQFFINKRIEVKCNDLKSTEELRRALDHFVDDLPLSPGCEVVAYRTYDTKYGERVVLLPLGTGSMCRNVVPDTLPREDSKEFRVMEIAGDIKAEIKDLDLNVVCSCWPTISMLLLESDDGPSLLFDMYQHRIGSDDEELEEEEDFDDEDDEFEEEARLNYEYEDDEILYTEDLDDEDDEDFEDDEDDEDDDTGLHDFSKRLPSYSSLSTFRNQGSIYSIYGQLTEVISEDSLDLEIVGLMDSIESDEKDLEFSSEFPVDGRHCAFAYVYLIPSSCAEETSGHDETPILAVVTENGTLEGSDINRHYAFRDIDCLGVITPSLLSEMIVEYTNKPFVRRALYQIGSVITPLDSRMISRFEDVVESCSSSASCADSIVEGLNDPERVVRIADVMSRTGSTSVAGVCYGGCEALPFIVVANSEGEGEVSMNYLIGETVKEFIDYHPHVYMRDFAEGCTLALMSHKTKAVEDGTEEHGIIGVFSLPVHNPVRMARELSAQLYMTPDQSTTDVVAEWMSVDKKFPEHLDDNGYVLYLLDVDGEAILILRSKTSWAIGSNIRTLLEDSPDDILPSSLSQAIVGIAAVSDGRNASLPLVLNTDEGILDYVQDSDVAKVLHTFNKDVTEEERIKVADALSQRLTSEWLTLIGMDEEDNVSDVFCLVNVDSNDVPVIVPGDVIARTAPVESSIMGKDIGKLLSRRTRKGKAKKIFSRHTRTSKSQIVRKALRSRIAHGVGMEPIYLKRRKTVLTHLEDSDLSWEEVPSSPMVRKG
jgi:hypothetical protein